MSELKVRDLTPAFGVEIEGLDPQIPLDDEQCRQLRELFDERSVLVFRNLDIDEHFQKYLCYMLIGEEVSAGSRVDDREDPEPARPTFYVSNKTRDGGAPYGRLLFHCDTMWADNPQPVISLYGVEVEEPNVPTMFVSMGSAWDTLPDDLRTRVGGLEAKHGHEHYYPNRGGDDDVIDTYYEDPKSTTTKVAHRHPRTGRTGLYVSEQVTLAILGLEEDENEELLAELFSRLYDPAQVIEHEWHKGDLIVWDNMAVQHARKTVELDGPTRTLRKVTGPLTISPGSVGMPVFSKVPKS